MPPCPFLATHLPVNAVFAVPGGEECEPRGAVGDAEDPQCDDDPLGTADRAHRLRAHWMTDCDVSLDRERRD